MFVIRKQFSFEAAHQLHGLPNGHQCGRLHGHSYRVELVLVAEQLDNIGFVVDYGELKPFRDYLDSNFDHRLLNEIHPDLEQPTAELIARHLFEVACQWWPQEVAGVRVSETMQTWAEYWASGWATRL
jgi:6-pyruvoyltetrahydropterin/6-carboxytetrahydropterin synthase